MTAIYIHSFLPKLSALCACGTAAMGAATGMVWLLGGKFQDVQDTISNMTGDHIGMVCDGAGNSCTPESSHSLRCRLPGCHAQSAQYPRNRQ